MSEAEETEKEIELGDSIQTQSRENMIKKTPEHDKSVEYIKETSGVHYWLFPLQLFYFWLLPLTCRGFKKALELKDLPYLTKQYLCASYVDRFHKIWRYLQNTKFRLYLTLYICFGVEFFVSGFLKLIGTILTVIYPIFLRNYVACLTPAITPSEIETLTRMRNILPPELRPSENLGELGYRENDYMVWVWLLSLFIAQVASIVIQQYSYYMAAKVGTKMRVLLSNLIYKKIFLLDNEGRSKKKEILTFLAFDTFIIDEGQHQFHETWTGIVQVVFSMYFVVSMIGAISLVSYLFFAIVVVSMFGLLTCILVFRVKSLGFTDKRIQKMKETLTNVIILKFFNLQDFYLSKIFDIRDNEVKYYRVFLLFRSFINSLAFSAPPFAIMLSFLFYFIRNGEFSTVLLLTTMSYFKMLQTPLAAISINFTRYMHTIAAMKRIEKFLQNKERSSEEIDQIKSPKNEKNAVEIEKGEFYWPNKKAEFTLKDINLEIKRGEMVFIVGNARSGKTTLIKSLLGETQKSEASQVRITGDFSFCDQETFLQNDTVFNNIVLDEKRENVNERKLREVLKICSLEQDLDRFHGRLQLQVGDNSITLSSGQKSRLSLARAVYYDGDIFLMDNTLATLDSFVSNSVFQYCISQYLREKTRILVCNKADFFPYADRIIFMKDGEIVENGSYDELVKANGPFREFIGDHVFEKDEGLAGAYDIKNYLQETAPLGSPDDVEETKVIDEEERATGVISYKSFLSYVSFLSPSTKNNLLSAVLILIGVFLVYLVAVGVYFFLELHVGYIAKSSMYFQKFGTFFNTSYYLNSTNASMYYYDARNESCPVSNVNSSLITCVYESVEIFWDSTYQNSTIMAPGLTVTQGLILYVLGVLALFVALIVASYTWFIVFLNTSKRIFKKVLTNLFKSSMAMYYVNPIGRILNRVSHDVARADYDLVVRGEFLFILCFFILGIFVQVLISSWGIFLPIIIAFLVAVICIYLFYRKTTIELKRLDAITKSEVFHHFNQTLNGLSTLEAFKLRGKFENKSCEVIDTSNRATFLMVAAKMNLRLALWIAGSFCLLIVGTASIIFSYYISFLPNLYELLGLGLMNLTTASEIFGTIFYNLVILEIELNSIERLDHYVQTVKYEKNLYANEECEDIDVKNGEIKFTDFGLRYREGFPLVLANMNITVAANEKIIIIGRTGSGKSTILLSVAQILRGCQGRIEVDGTDITKFSLTSLRNKISFIPADPVLLSGSIRSNIDPLNEFSDQEIQDMIKKCELEEIIARNPLGLDSVIEENGRNFSVGEKRLISLCRGLLRKPKILLLDECTSIDYRVDEEIQKVVVALGEVTVLSVTHRLNNIVFYDRVMVVDEGRIKEVDHHGKLITTKGSFLRNLVDLAPNKNELINLLTPEEEKEKVELIDDVSEGETEEGEGESESDEGESESVEGETDGTEESEGEEND